jgi:hypothetical protein
MYYTCVANVATKNGQMPEFLRKAEVELLPLYRELPGFVGFSVARIDDISAVSWSLWQTYDQAKRSITASERVISVGFGSLIDDIQSLVGEVPFLVFTGERAIGTTVKTPLNETTAPPVAGRQR